MPASLTETRLADPDRAYRMLIEAHRGLTDAESAALNARLILLLANQVGDVGAFADLIAAAKAAMPARVK